MKKPLRLVCCAALAVAAITVWTRANARSQKATTAKIATLSTREPSAKKIVKIHRSDEQWRRQLTPAQFNILRRAGTEVPWSHNDKHGAGKYLCAGCGLALFSSKTKFDSGTGWPSFFRPVSGHVATRHDNSLGWARVEVLCARCDGHLGHVFDDGPAPTGLRYCMNGLALRFEPTR